MTPVFLDTVGLLAPWDVSDQWHLAAESAFMPLVEEKSPLITTAYGLLECANSAAKKPYRSAAAELREKMEKSETLVIPTGADWEAAWSA